MTLSSYFVHCSLLSSGHRLKVIKENSSIIVHRGRLKPVSSKTRKHC